MTPFILGFAAICAVLSFGLRYRFLWMWYVGWIILYLFAAYFGSFFFSALYLSETYQGVAFACLYLLGGLLVWVPFVLGWIYCRRFFGKRPPATPDQPSALYPQMNPEAARKIMIDVLRGAAAIAVVLFHFNEPYPPLSDLYHRALKWGWLGVPVFFAISGYCIADARKKDGLISFWFRRLMRIFPPYWASILVVVAVIALRRADTGINDITILPGDASSLIYTALALTNPASSVPGVNWVYWSLGYELAFYLVMGVLVYRPAGLWTILFSALSLFVPAFPFDHWGLFGLGVAGHYYLQKKHPVSALLALLCIASSFVHLGLIQTLGGVFTTLLILFPPAWIARLLFRPLAQAGLFSYSLYLIHVPIGCYLLRYYFPIHFERQLIPSLAQDFLFLIICLLSAYAFYRLIEKPSHSLARRITSRPISPPAAPQHTR